MRIIILTICAALFVNGCASKPKEPRHYHHSYHIVKKGDTLFSISWRYGIDAKQLAKWNNIPYPYTIYPGQKLRVNSTAPTSSTAYKSSNKKKTTEPVKSTQAKKKVRDVPVGDWRWPVRGKLVSKFSGKNNGIDIAAKEGTVVSAASAGKVVYAG